MDWTSLFGFIGDAIDSQVGALADFTVSGFSSLLSDITGVWGVVTGLIGWVKSIIGGILGWIHDFWDWLKNISLSGIIDWIKRHWQALKDWLKQLKKNIDLYKKNLQDTWNLYVKPILNFIQNLRRAILIFRLLGFKWAKQLDQYLVDVENKINAAFLATWQNLNLLSNWINWILDPLGLWSSNVWFGALGQSLSAIWAMVWGAPQSGLGAQQLAADQQLTQNYFITQQRVQIGERAGLAGPLPADISNANSVMAQLQALGYNPPLF
jgi:hypothetical protein